jgi:hypothetical protein
MRGILPNYSAFMKRNQSEWTSAAEFFETNHIAHRIWFAIPQPTEWQRIGNEIKAAFIFARAHFVFVHREP